MAIDKLRWINANVNRTYLWVASHQEDDSQDVNIQANERADDLATETRENVVNGLQHAYPKQFFDGSHAILQINGSLVTKDLKDTIHKALYGPALDDFLKGKYSWAEITFANIDWKSLERALRKTQGNTHTMIIKLMHRWQPTNLHVQRNDRRPAAEGKCLGCGEPDTQWHYLKCTSQHFCDARAKAWCKFCNHMKLYQTQETFLRIIWIGIQNWIYQDFDEALPQGDDVSQEQYTLLTKAYEDQGRIGWQHFVVGRVSKSWTEFYATTLPEDKTKQGKIIAFGKNLVEATWAFALEVWKSHNGMVHGTGSGYSKKDIRAIHDSVAELYATRHNYIKPEDEWLFGESERIKKKLSIPQLLGWIERAISCIPFNKRKNYEALCNAQYILHRMCLKSLFA